MTVSTYGGESNPKKIARASVWEELVWEKRLRETSQKTEGFYPNELSVENSVVVGLCGENGFDSRVAAALSFGQDNIFLVDHDPLAIETAKHRSGVSANFVAGDFFEVANDTLPDVLLFDDCALLLSVAEQWEALSRICRRRGPGTNIDIIVCGKYGRDKRQLHRPKRPEESAWGLRVCGFLKTVRNAQQKMGLSTSARSVHRYVSRRFENGKWKQSPMVYVRFVVYYPETPKNSKRARYQIARRDMFRAATSNIARWEDHGSDPTEQGLRAWAESHFDPEAILPLSTSNIANCLCVPPRKVAAWKAVHTMRAQKVGAA